MRRFARAFWPVALWASVIFAFSTNLGASSSTSRLLGPLLNWMLPSLSAEQLQDAVFVVRKGAHVFEYAVLSLLILRGLRLRNREMGVPDGRWRTAFVAWVASVVYAATDELHQAFVASRTGTPIDVLVDAVGAALGVAVATAWRSRRRADANDGPR